MHADVKLIEAGAIIVGKTNLGEFAASVRDRRSAAATTPTT